MIDNYPKEKEDIIEEFVSSIKLNQELYNGEKRLAVLKFINLLKIPRKGNEKLFSTLLNKDIAYETKMNVLNEYGIYLDNEKNKEVFDMVDLS